MADSGHEDDIPESYEPVIRLTTGRGITYQQIGLAQLLGALARGRPDVVLQDDDDDDDDYVDDDDLDPDPPTSGRTNWFPEVTEPVPAGEQLLMSGDFGQVGTKLRHTSHQKNLGRLALDRPARPTLTKEHILTNLVPNTNGTAVASCDANIYTAQFSGDSSFYYTCSQDFKLHIFDTTAGLLPRHMSTGSAGHHMQSSNLSTRLHLKHTINGHSGRWTITDANLSPNNERLIYSSITSTVYMVNTHDPSAPQQPIRFSDPLPRGRHAYDSWGYDDGFGIWSCRFSADGNEVVAGGDGKIFVYDLLADRRTVKISAHNDDINSCCWADTSSGNVLISASDDTFLKVWDRRSLGASNKPSGVLVGHTEGITYVSAKGDGRYVVSNGKDQAARLWDLRKMCSSTDFETFEHKSYGHRHYDYRYSRYPRPRHKAHPKDCSVMTYRGHAVLRTLIRCHFSPIETTGSQYLYSGSADGKIHIWNLDGRVVQVLDRSHTLSPAADPDGPEPVPARRLSGRPCVRDVSWHSQQPILMSAAWESDYRRGGSVVAQHEWKGLSKMRGNLEDVVAKMEEEEQERARRVRLRFPGSFDVDDDDPDWVDEEED